MAIKLIDYDPHGATDGDVFTLDVDGRTIIIERWANSNMSGMEINEPGSGRSFTDFEHLGEDADKEIEKIIERVDDLWSDAWVNTIYPIYEQERVDVIARIKAETEE